MKRLKRLGIIVGIIILTIFSCNLGLYMLEIVFPNDPALLLIGYGKYGYGFLFLLFVTCCLICILYVLFFIYQVIRWIWTGHFYESN